MSTPGSERLRLSLIAVGAATALYLALSLALGAAARAAERSGEVYPYRWTGWLRYQLPTLWPTDGKPLLLVAGPSTAREAFRVERFEAAFPSYRVFQGALSAGTLGDVMASLEYVDREHGRGAMPKIVILGVSPRFIADIAARHPFADGLRRYSPRLVVPDTSHIGFGLVERPRLEGVAARLRFLLRQQTPRYRAAAAWWFGRHLPEGLDRWLRGPAPSAVLERLTWSRSAEVGPRVALLEMVRPYRYSTARHRSDAEVAARVDDDRSWWKLVYRWDPHTHASEVVPRVRALRQFLADRGIALVAVELPERSMGRARYLPDFGFGYQQLLQEAFESTPLLNLRCQLDDSEFYDTEHPLPAGGERITQRTIGFLSALQRAGHSGIPGAIDPIPKDSLAAITARWSAPCELNEIL